MQTYPTKLTPAAPTAFAIKRSPAPLPIPVELVSILGRWNQNTERRIGAL